MKRLLICLTFATLTTAIYIFPHTYTSYLIPFDYSYYPPNYISYPLAHSLYSRDFPSRNYYSTSPVTSISTREAKTPARIPTGYVAQTRGSLHIAPHPEGPFTSSYHINTAPAPGTN